MTPPISSAEVLRRTSRTFALSIRLLPRPVRGPVEAAYLVARIADTVADAGAVPVRVRIDRLDRLVAAIREGESAAPIERLAGEGRIAGPGPTAAAEEVLVASAGRWLERMRALPGADRRDVERVVTRLATTMRGELEWFSRGKDGDVVALPDAGALRAYTEGIAGCVGEFWTSLLGRHVCRWTPRRANALSIAGRRYGRGLQLVNVLRDVAADLTRGRCFLPALDLSEAGLDPGDLALPGARERLRPVAERWASRSRGALLAGLAYSSRLDGAGWRVRLATALPSAIGLVTLATVARDEAWLDPSRKTAISRARLRAVVARAALLSVFPRGPRRLATLGG